MVSLLIFCFSFNRRFHTPGPTAPVTAPVAAPVAVPVPAPNAAPVPSPIAAPVPVGPLSLVLINANTNADISPLTNGMTISLSSTALNVRIQPVAPAGVRSVVFNYDNGILIRTENTAPYTLAASVWTPTLGAHTIVATAFSAGNGGGVIVGIATVSFVVATSAGPTAPVAPPVPRPVPVPVPVLAPVPVPAPVAVPPVPVSSTFSLVLVNALTDTDIGSLVNGMRVALGSVGRSLNVRLQPAPLAGKVGSVVFRYDNGTSPFRIENGAPYSFAGDVNGNYNSWTPTVDSHTIIATVFAGGSGSGGIIATVSVSFQVVN
jgi:hypothetical protein